MIIREPYKALIEVGGVILNLKSAIADTEESVDKTVDMHKKSFCIMLPRKKGNDVLIPYAPSGRYWEDDNSPKDPPINSKSPPRRKSKRLQDLERKK